MTSVCLKTLTDSVARRFLSLTPHIVQHQPRRGNFFEADRKSGYFPNKQERHNVETFKKMIKQEMRDLKPEFGKFKEEWVRKLRCDEVYDQQHGDYEAVWRFNDAETINTWIVTQDKDFDEGNSKSEFVLGPNKKGVFRGVLDCTVPKDGIIKETGYCNIASEKHQKSFKRDEPYDWERYNHLLLRVRGDGRTYQVVVGMHRYYDLTWNDQFTYPLYTRGGPYWQIAKIPFSKFYLAAKGRIQDKQEKLDPTKVSYVGVTLADAHDGPFNLEIDYIGLYYDSNHTQEFAYEMYEVPPYMLY